MNIERKIDMAKEILMWIYVAAVAVGICYASCTGQTAKSPGQIIFEKTHTR